MGLELTQGLARVSELYTTHGCSLNLSGLPYITAQTMQDVLEYSHSVSAEKGGSVFLGVIDVCNENIQRMLCSIVDQFPWVSVKACVVSPELLHPTLARRAGVTNDSCLARSSEGL